MEKDTPLASFHAQDQAGLDPETIRAWRFLDSQGCHFVLVNRDKIPIHRRWQLPWERPSLDKVLRHLAGGGMVGHVPAAVGTVVLDLDESDDDGSRFMDRHPPFWDIPSRRSGGMHMYYLSRVQYGNRDWRMGSAAGQLRSRERLRRHLGSPCPGRHAGLPEHVSGQPRGPSLSRRGAGGQAPAAPGLGAADTAATAGTAGRAPPPVLPDPAPGH